MTGESANAIRTSRADVWYLKEISFGEEESRRSTKIITQNFNGPCSFIAICNILILRGSIQVLPQERRTVSYEFLSQLVADYLLNASPDVDTSAALSIMPLTQKGMDLNPVFTSATAFRPAGDGGELKLFERAGIKLVHGWLVDPEWPGAAVIAKTPDYDSAVNLIALADYTSKGQLVSGDMPSVAGPSNPTSDYTEEERERLEDAILVRDFINSTQSQLTYHGLFHLASSLEPDTLVALFRNSHLSVLYRSKGDSSSLYSLVTDHVFLNESSVVWERLEDVDGGSSTFVDSDFAKSAPAGGDIAGHTGESALAALDAQKAEDAPVDPADLALAMQLQAQEDEYARQLYEQRKQLQAERQQAEALAQAKQAGREAKVKEKVSCVIM